MGACISSTGIQRQNLSHPQGESSECSNVPSLDYGGALHTDDRTTSGRVSYSPMAEVRQSLSLPLGESSRYSNFPSSDYGDALLTDDRKTSGRVSYSPMEEVRQNLFHPLGESSRYSNLPSSDYGGSLLTDDGKTSGRVSPTIAYSPTKELRQNLSHPQGESSRYSSLPSSDYGGALLTDDRKTSGRVCPSIAYSPTKELRQNLSHPQGLSLSSSDYDGALVTDNRKRLERRCLKIADNYSSLEEVNKALACAGLESSKLIVGIDFTKSNEWTGGRALNRRSLHHIGDVQNPYEQAIFTIGKTLAEFDEDGFIPCFGFGDASTHDQDVFGFYPDDSLCNGFEDVLTSYKEIVPYLRLSGPTSYAPIIEMAMTIVEKSGRQFHVLLIITSGQLGVQKQKTVDVIVEASKLPLSIIFIGVGDGPWDTVKELGDNIPNRAVDNLQFVNFTDIMTKNVPPPLKEAEFALTALMKIPSQYKATRKFSTSGGQNDSFLPRVPLAPLYYRDKCCSICCSGNLMDMAFRCGHKLCCKCGERLKDCPICLDPSPIHTKIKLIDQLICPRCQTNRIDMAFDCGHQTCCKCGEAIQSCPICKSAILNKIKLF